MLSLAVGPSAVEQELLEHLNRMRLSPSAELEVLFESLDPLRARDPDAAVAVELLQDPTSGEIQGEWAVLSPVPPLAWNDSLASAARLHSERMVAAGVQSHQLPGEPPLEDRVEEAGYTDWFALGENVFAYAESPFHAHSAFAIDWGVPDRNHRQMMMDDSFWEVGIGIVTDPDTQRDFGPLVVTEDFGARADGLGPTLLGVAYDDLNANGRYDAGEGLPGVLLEIEGTAGTFQTLTMGAGGYQIQLPDGIYDIRASGDVLVGTREVFGVAVLGSNVKVDFEQGSPILVDLNGPDSEGNDHRVAFLGGQGPTLVVDPLMTVTGGEADQLSSATILMTDIQSPNEETLQVDVQGTAISADYDFGTGTLSLAGVDSAANYQAVLRTLTYDNTSTVPGESTRGVEIVVGDGVTESEATATVIDVVIPEFGTISVADAVLSEGDYGQTDLVFTVSLSLALEYAVTVDYTTIDQTAVAGDDYLEQTGQITFQPSQTIQTISVPVLGDVLFEADRTFLVEVSNPRGAALIGDGQANGVILDDDLWSELGPIQQTWLDALDLSTGRRLYRLSASRSGWLTLEGLFDGPSDAVQLTLYDSDRNETPLAASTFVDGVARIDYQAQQGETFFLSVEGTVDDVDVRLTNLLGQSEALLTVAGTEGDDRFEFDASAGYWIEINGVGYDLGSAAATSILFTAGDGSDTVVLHDSPADDVLTVSPGWAQFEGEGFAVEMSGFERMLAYAKSGGQDTANLSGSSGDETFTATPAYAKLIGANFYHRVQSFETTVADAGVGGKDLARLYDSPNDDHFVGSPEESRLWAEDGSFALTARSFDLVLAYSLAGGYDTALLEDSPGNDHFVGRSYESQLYSDTFLITARRFREVVASAIHGGRDTAELFGTLGDDHLEASGNWAAISASDLSLYRAVAFEAVVAHASEGRDTADVAAEVDFLMLDDDWQQ